MTKSTSKYLVAAGAAILTGGSRFAYETSTARMVIDAQGGIWLMYSLFVSVFTALVVFLLAMQCQRSFEKNSRVVGCIFLIALLAICGWTGGRMVELFNIRRALADSANSQTSPERLTKLVGYESGFGYEIDNRLASNPHTPTEVLRHLHQRDQLGTDICLAKNPRTPDDVLRALAQSKEEWVQKALRFNPRYREIAGVIGPQEP